MISLASSVQTCVSLANNAPFPPLPSCSTGHDHPWMVLFHAFVPQTYPPPLICACKRKQRKKRWLAPNGYDAWILLALSVNQRRKLHYHRRPVSSTIFLVVVIRLSSLSSPMTPGGGLRHRVPSRGSPFVIETSRFFAVFSRDIDKFRRN